MNNISLYTDIPFIIREPGPSDAYYEEYQKHTKVNWNNLKPWEQKQKLRDRANAKAALKVRRKKSK